MLEARAIFKRFCGEAVLRGVDLKVAPGEVVGLVGMNGSGKTTFLDVLSGKVRPDAGEIWIDGERAVPGRAFAPRRPLFRSYQVPRLFYGLSVADNVLLGRWALSIDGGPIDAGIGTLNQDNPAKTLSIGQRRRVIFDWVRARIGRAKYLLLDEPAAGGDDALVDLLRDLLLVAREQGCGVLLIEHRDGVIKSMCDRIVYLRDGICSKDANGFDVALRPVDRVEPVKDANGPQLIVKDLTIARGGALVLRGINLDLNPGEAAVVTGPNGCGKSTLLRAIYGDPSCSVVGGCVTSEGRNLAAFGLRERMAIGIHLMPQDGMFFPSMTVEEALRTSVEAAAPSNWNAKAVADVRAGLPILNRIWRHRCGLLSGGERRLVSLARVSLLRPLIALLDEPLAGVDIQSAVHVIKILSDLRSKGTALLVAEQTGLLNALPHDRLIELPQNSENSDWFTGILPKVPHALAG